MKSFKTTNEKQEVRIAALEDRNVKLNEHATSDRGTKWKFFIIKHAAIEMFMENEEFQALWNNINETFTRLKKSGR